MPTITQQFSLRVGIQTLVEKPEAFIFSLLLIIDPRDKMENMLPITDKNNDWH